MTPELWRRIEQALDELQALAEPQRALELERLRQNDPKLSDEVEKILAVASDADGFLDTPVWSAREAVPRLDDAADSTAQDRKSPMPERVGPYRIEKVIGQGGMGEVFLARRDDGEFEQKVALKWLDADPSHLDLVRRFREERQILAELEHPNIARLIDGGTVFEGRPYLVMEYVEGIAIDRWCEVRGTTVAQRLRLFAKVCSAVQAAHRNLVVHRDLKPSNILVDADGEPKLLDFGIAKVLSRQERKVSAGERDARWMTPLYSSPEQIRGEAITTATDVHALGLLLFVLLTGRHPFAAENLEDVTRQIEQDQPRPPSRLAPTARARRLRGDLDAIVAKALAKLPENRYDSAAQLADDIHRHLRYQPVTARRSTLRYTLGCLIRRNQIATALTAAITLLILGFSVTSAVLWRQAVREKARAVEVAEFLEDLYQLPDPRRDEGTTITALELLRRSAGSLEKELEQLPLDRAHLMLAVGSAYRGLGQNEQAASFLGRGLELLDDSAIGMSRQRLAGLLDLAAVRRENQNPRQAAALLARALEALRSGHYDHPRLAKIVNNHASLLDWQAHFVAAEALYREVLAMKLRLYGEEHEEVATTWNNLAATLLHQGEVVEAEDLLRRALDSRRRLLGQESPRTLGSQNNLAVLLRDQGKLEEAETMFRTNLAIRQRLLGPEHRAVGNVLNNLAMTRQLRGDFAEASLLFADTARIFEQAYGTNHVNSAVVKRNRASLSLEQGEAAVAEQLIREALETFKNLLGEEHWRVADAESVLGASLMSAGQKPRGGFLLSHGLERLEATKGDSARETREARQRLARWAPPDS